MIARLVAEGLLRVAHARRRLGVARRADGTKFVATTSAEVSERAVRPSHDVIVTRSRILGAAAGLPVVKRRAGRPRKAR